MIRVKLEKPSELWGMKYIEGGMYCSYVSVRYDFGQVAHQFNDW